MSEEEKKSIETLTSILKEIDEGVQTIHTENLFDNIEIILKLIDKQQKEIEIWKETENDYEHELARKDKKIEKQQKEIEILKGITEDDLPF